MSEYILENNFDFYKQLNTIVDSKEEENSTEENSEEQNKCLITGEDLTDNHVTLMCNHKFNYIPLYDEICKQKYSRKNIPKLYVNQLKCPFCRNIQNKILPNISSMNVKNILGVNSPNKYCMFLNTCSYVFKSGKRKGETCMKKCNDKMCMQHMKNKKTTQQCERCKFILVKGKNKGKQCSFLGKFDGYCSKHNVNN